MKKVRNVKKLDILKYGSRKLKTFYYRWLFLYKVEIFEKVTKFEKISHLFWNLLSNKCFFSNFVAFSYCLNFNTIQKSYQ